MHLIVIAVPIASIPEDGNTVHAANETTEPAVKMDVIGRAHVQAEQKGKMQLEFQTL